jgi:hypothetical protein
MSELSLEPAIKGRFDESICAFPAESPKSVLVPFLGRQSLRENRRWCSLHRRGRSVARGRTVRDLAQGIGFLPDRRMVRAYRPEGPRMRRCGGSHRRRLDLAPGRDPVGEERS